MTTEEAVEIILLARQYETCSNCDGSGKVQKAAPTYTGKQHLRARPFGNSKRVGGDEGCRQCQGFGVQTRKAYMDACDTLGMACVIKNRPMTPGKGHLFDEDTQEWVDCR